MAVLYRCDRCGQETKEAQITVMDLSGKGGGKVFHEYDLCSSCVQELFTFMKREG